MTKIKVGDWVKRKPQFMSEWWKSICSRIGQLPGDAFKVTQISPLGIQLLGLPGLQHEPAKFVLEAGTSMKIFKYTLPIQEETSVEMPIGAQIIRVDGLDGGLWIWAIIDENAATEKRHFKLFKTGAAMPNDILNYTYLGCGAIFIQQELMLYVFEKQSA